ncbi:MAG: LacI family DNA-binding transcriptional regulator [Candidatus Limnocylindrales bacterium]
MTTLKAVAAHADVSLATAARVLRDDPTLTVRPATRERVLTAARDLGYRPNRVASGLRTHRTGTIAIVLPDPQNVMWGETLRGIERAAGERDYVVVVADAHGPTLDATQLGRFVLEGRMDGLLVAFATIADELVAQIAGRGLPLVPINSRSPVVAGSVTMDDAAGSRLAVEHLVGLGHRRIGFVAGRGDTDVGRRRDAGYRSALADHGIPVDEAWITAGDFTERGAHESVIRLLDSPEATRPTALYAVNLMSALGARGAARELGLRIPGDLSLVTMDDHPLLGHTDPPLTAVQMPMAEMGELGARMLLDVVEGRTLGHVVTTTPPRLVVRRSAAAPLASA